MTTTGSHSEAENLAATDSDMAAFLDPGLDFGQEDLSEDEARRYLAWCARVHGEGNLDLVPFAEFFVEFDPAGLKRLRRHTGTIGLPIEAAVLMWAHTYCVLGFSKGVLYEVIAARELGVNRSAVIEVLRVAGFIGGPLALNAAGELTSPYLRQWTAGDDEPVTWPAGWSVDPGAFASGIDQMATELTGDEMALVRAWYARVHGGMPPALETAAAMNPSAFKMAHVRFERLAGDHIPVQLIPLLLVHTGAATGRSALTKRGAELARSVGLDDRIVAATIHWAGAVGGTWTLEQAFADAGIKPATDADVR